MGQHQADAPRILASQSLWLLTGCGGDAREGISPEFADQLRTARDAGSVAVPERLPRDLTDAWVTTADDTTSVSFYSTNAPVVTVCSGDAERCRSQNP